MKFSTAQGWNLLPANFPLMYKIKILIIFIIRKWIQLFKRYYIYKNEYNYSNFYLNYFNWVCNNITTIINLSKSLKSHEGYTFPSNSLSSQNFSLNFDLITFLIVILILHNNLILYLIVILLKLNILILFVI